MLTRTESTESTTFSVIYHLWELQLQGSDTNDSTLRVKEMQSWVVMGPLASYPLLLIQLFPVLSCTSLLVVSHVCKGESMWVNCSERILLYPAKSQELEKLWGKAIGNCCRHLGYSWWDASDF